MSISAKTVERIKTSLKKFQPILQSAKTRDINESDTVTIIADMLEHVFGFDKYTEITSEYLIRGTYCDLAIKLDGKLVLLMEVKAIGIELKDHHVKQAIDYAANEGVEWIVLTNGIEWRIYRVTFGKPVGFDLVESFDLVNISLKEKTTMDLLSLITKEGLKKSKLEEHHSYKQILNKFTIGAILLSDEVVNSIRKKLKYIAPEAKVSVDEIKKILNNEVIKREVIDGEKSQLAQKQISRAEKKALKKVTEIKSDNDSIIINSI
jgi:hypothetical protein